MSVFVMPSLTAGAAVLVSVELAELPVVPSGGVTVAVFVRTSVRSASVRTVKLKVSDPPTAMELVVKETVLVSGS